jgi:hypothetical protein
MLPQHKTTYQVAAVWALQPDFKLSMKITLLSPVHVTLDINWPVYKAGNCSLVMSDFPKIIIG